MLRRLHMAEAAGRAGPTCAGDFRPDSRCLPLAKGGQEGFVDESFEQVPLDPLSEGGSFQHAAVTPFIDTPSERRGFLGSAYPSRAARIWRRLRFEQHEKATTDDTDLAALLDRPLSAP